MSEKALSIANIRGLGGSDAGQFRAAGEALGWKNKRTGAVVQYKKDELKDAVWVKSGRECSLVLYVNSDVTRFDGFKDEDFMTVAKHFADNFNVTIEKRTMSSKGFHWGEWEVTDRNISIMNKDKPLIDIATSEISQVLVAAKTEVTLEFKPPANEDPDAVELLEVRFYVPPSTKAAPEAEEGATNEDGETPAPVLSTMEEFKNAIESVASGMSTSVDTVVTTFSDISMQVPRAKYDLQMSMSSMRFAGKTFSFNVRYDQITSAFFLPLPGNSKLLVAFSLNAEVRQGQSRYRWLVAHIDSNVEAKQTFRMPEGAAQLAEYNLQETMADSQYRLLGKVLQSFPKVKLLSMPAEGGFFAANKADRCVGCTYKAESGNLWLLEKHLLFGHKPMVWVKLANIQFVEFTGSQGNKFFELRVATKDPNSAYFDFGAIDKVELSSMQAFFEAKGIRVKAEVSAKQAAHVPGFSSDEDDSDYEDDDEDDESDDGSYASDDGEGSSGLESESEGEEVKKEKKSKKEKKEKKSKKEKKEKKSKKEKKEKKSKKSSKGDDDAPSKRRGSDNEDEEPSAKRAKADDVKTEQE